MAEQILETIAAATKIRVAELKKYKSLTEVIKEAEALPKALSLQEALSAPGLSVIAELKKASPSKGLISPDFERLYQNQAKAYAEGGAAAISCLTEPQWFLGKDEFLKNVRQLVQIPILRKDFIVDEYQIFEAKIIGADAVLLICSLMSQCQLEDYMSIVKEIGLSALVETHTSEEVEMALRAGAEIIGVNNRNLRDFTVNPTNSLRLRDSIPQDKIFVAESGIKEVSDCQALKAAGVNAVLIGEALMRSGNPAKFIADINK